MNLRPQRWPVHPECIRAQDAQRSVVRKGFGRLQSDLCKCRAGKIQTALFDLNVIFNHIAKDCQSPMPFAMAQAVVATSTTFVR
eukprot:2974707-Amphidinium_carterae.1